MIFRKAPKVDKKKKKMMNESVHGAQLIAGVCKVLDRLTLGSPFFENNTRNNFPKFSQQDEIVMGEELGYGEFGVVHSVTEMIISKNDQSSNETQNTSSVNKRDKEKDSDVVDTGDIKLRGLVSDNLKMPDEEVAEEKEFMIAHCVRNGESRYAIKTLKPDLGIKYLPRAMLDLAIEARTLEVLSHPNIIKMRGMGNIHGHRNFFIVLDRLLYTLANKCDQWRMEKKKLSKWLKFGKTKKAKVKDLFRDRLIAMYDIARAMKYIHDHNVMYRDLKPENIGFDVRGNAKIFDFGLVKELLPKNSVGNGLYIATGLTGSRRYMAPEVLLCKHYGLSADVYSFSILLWEVIALEIPFEFYSCEEHANIIIKGENRPKVDINWPSLAKEIIRGGWTTDPLIRPDFCGICEMLQGEIISWNEDKSGSSMVLNRSTQLMDQSNSSKRN